MRGRKKNASRARTNRFQPRRGSTSGTASSTASVGRTSVTSAGDAAGVGDERQVPRALDRRRQLSLMARTDAAQAARQNLAVVRDEAAEGAVILVVDEVHPALAERAGLGRTAHLILLLFVFRLTTAG